MDQCNHEYQYFGGKDATIEKPGPFERYCIVCGKIELYSGIANEWIYVANFYDTLPEELNAN